MVLVLPYSITSFSTKTFGEPSPIACLSRRSGWMMIWMEMGYRHQNWRPKGNPNKSALFRGIVRYCESFCKPSHLQFQQVIPMDQTKFLLQNSVNRSTILTQTWCVWKMGVTQVMAMMLCQGFWFSLSVCGYHEKSHYWVLNNDRIADKTQFSLDHEISLVV